MSTSMAALSLSALLKTSDNYDPYVVCYFYYYNDIAKKDPTFGKNLKRNNLYQLFYIFELRETLC